MKAWNSNRIINVIGITVYIILFVLLFIFSEQKVFIGVLERLTLALMVIYNSLYLVLTNKPNFMYKDGAHKNRKLVGFLLLVVGLFGFITALMGYGINGYPLFDWKTIL